MNFSISKKTQRQASIAALAGIAIVGAASLIFSTYPHLNPFHKETKEVKDSDPNDPTDEQEEVVEETVNEVSQ